MIVQNLPNIDAVYVMIFLFANKVCIIIYGKIIKSIVRNYPRKKRWNMIKINSAITQGILQGESIGKIADRLQIVTDMNRAQALRNARTLHTQAESKGRERRYEEAEKLGIPIMRQWIAILDNRTRDAHRELDGQIRPRGVPFENSLGKIMYPADKNAAPANVYNCRCAERGLIEGHEYNTNRFTQKGYDEWKRGKKAYTKYLEDNGIDSKYGRLQA